MIILLQISCMNSPNPTIKEKIPMIEQLTLRQKIAQMIMVRVRGDFYNNENWYQKKLQKWIEVDEIGGIITFGGSIHGTASNIKKFQSWSRVPLLVSADYERGVGQWLEGATLFPSNMAITATDETELSYKQGEITAIEAKSLGVHVTFAPVLDVNNNPQNPIINFRSYSDNPLTVSKYGNAFIRGVQENGIMACAKHFPGHGNTATDSHSSLPTVTTSRDELEKTELSPFKLAIENGVKMVMIGHIAMPALDSTSKPASHSQLITEQILRNDWGYEGLIVTDGMEMGGLTESTWAGESAIRSIEAGADILLLPINVEQSIDAIENAVILGRISEYRINQSVKRILEAKKEFVINQKPTIENNIGIYAHRKVANEIAKKSITLIKDIGQLPIKPEMSDTLTHIILSTDDGAKDMLSSFTWDVRNTHGNVEEVYLNSKLTKLQQISILENLKNTEEILITLLVRIRMDKGESTIDTTHAELLSLLKKNNIPFITVGFGSPYLPNYESLDTYLCAYGYGKVSQIAMANALFGRNKISGKLPIDLSEMFSRGDGLVQEKRESVTAVENNVSFVEAFEIIDNAIKGNVFPGAQILIARKGKVLANQGFGQFTYSDTSKSVDTETIYDIASLTKVVATVPIVQKLIERKILSLDYEVSQFFPEFIGNGKEKVTVRHLLTHSSGLKPFEQYFLNNNISNKAEVLKDILNQELLFEPGTQTKYSDLGMILLMAIIEKVSDRTIDELTKSYVTDPLEMSNSLFNPDISLKNQISPTEYDDIYRHRLVHGEVHDENTFLMGGISTHAGLFSTASDIANYAQMVINRGLFLGKRILKSEIIEEFTKRQELPTDSERALGWDTPSQNGESSAGDYFSDTSFGHLGFTGTSLWIDPEQDIIIVLLSNRVYPSRENNGMYQVRRDFHNSVMKQLMTIN